VYLVRQAGIVIQYKIGLFNSGSRSLLTDLVRQAGIVVQYKIGEGSFGKCVKVLNRKNRQVVLV
jgi:hypothetical protein